MNLKTETKFRAGIAMSLLGLIMVTFAYSQQQDELQKYRSANIEIQKLDDLKDSLESELFVRDIQINRYEVALELFREKNKTGADEFELIMTTQTE